MKFLFYSLLLILVFLFYPNDFSFVCPTEILAFNEKYEEFKSRDTELIVISGDSVYSHLKWQQLTRSEGGIGKLNCIHASDFTHDLIKTLGIYYMNEEDKADKTNGGCYRALFIVDNEGKIYQSLINHTSIGRSVDECIRTLDALQYVKKTGNVCQAMWKKGDEGIKSD